MKTDLLGPYAKPREWLLRYLKTARFTNPMMSKALEGDWSECSKERAAYLVGVTWGRLRQTDNALETAHEFFHLVEKEMENEG